MKHRPRPPHRLPKPSSPQKIRHRCAALPDPPFSLTEHKMTSRRNFLQTATGAGFAAAALAAGDSLKDPAAYVRRLNKLLVELSA